MPICRSTTFCSIHWIQQKDLMLWSSTIIIISSVQILINISMSFSWAQGIVIIPWAISVGNSLLLGQAKDTFEVGCSWPGVFLLEANGRMDRFLTQLLFPNCISGNGYRTLTAKNKHWNCLHFVLNLILLTKTAINWEWKLLCVFFYFTRDTNRFYYRAINTVSWKGVLPLTL